MTRLLVGTAILVVAAGPAFGGNQLPARPAVTESQPTPIHDHPKAQTAPSRDVKIDVTFDQILRSCCAPPSLIVAGNVTNTSAKPIDYLKLKIWLRDAQGKVVYNDELYNHGAVSLGEDPMVAEALNEKPHFDPLAPGARDTFNFQIPLPGVPRYQSVTVAVAEVKRNSVTASR